MHGLVRIGVVVLGFLAGITVFAGTPAEVIPVEKIHRAVAALDADDPIAAEALLRPLAEAGQPDAQHLLGFLYDLGLGVPYDLKTGNVWQEKAAQQGHYWARRYLGWKLGLGLGVESPDLKRAEALQAGTSSQSAPKRVVPEDWLLPTGSKFSPNYLRAAVWLQARAAQGDAMAAFTFAEYQLIGFVNGRRDQAEHVRWLKISADAGYAPAAVRLKLYYGLGVVVEKNEALSHAYLEKAARAGDAASQYELGKEYAQGTGHAKDPAQARDWYQRAAAAGNLEAINALADLLRRGAPGVAPDLVEARRLSQQAGDLGSGEALADLAGMNRRGQGGPVDLAAAERFYRQASDKGYTYATMMLGWITLYDRKPPAYDEARSWFEKAAAAGSETAMYQLGRLYDNGWGVSRDPAQAFVWYEKAAREGDGEAQNQVGWMLRQGVGVEQDDEEAVSWFKLAAKNGEWRGDSNLFFHYTQGRGVPRDVTLAFNHAVIVLRAQDDEWTSTNFVWLFARPNDEERRQLHELLQTLCGDPALMKAQGRLPELCVQAAHLLGDRALAEQLVAALETSGRPSAAELIAWQAFHGEDMPYDLTKARKWAQAAKETNSKQGAFVEAYIESVVAPTPEERAAASKVLHRLADEGHERATYVVAYRHALGLAEPLDQQLALSYYHRLSYGKDVTLEKFLEQVGLKHISEVHLTPDPAPADPLVDSPPRPLQYPPPFYPKELAAAHFRGSVTIEAVIDESGGLQDIHVTKSDHPLLAASAEATVKLWRFVPARKDGKAVRTHVSQTLVFDPHQAP